MLRSRSLGHHRLQQDRSLRALFVGAFEAAFRGGSRRRWVRWRIFTISSVFECTPVHGVRLGTHKRWNAIWQRAAVLVAGLARIFPGQGEDAADVAGQFS